MNWKRNVIHFAQNSVRACLVELLYIKNKLVRNVVDVRNVGTHCNACFTTCIALVHGQYTLSRNWRNSMIPINKLYIAVVYCNLRHLVYCNLQHLVYCNLQHLVYCNLQHLVYCNLQHLVYCNLQHLVYCNLRHLVYCNLRHLVYCNTYKYCNWNLLHLL